MDDSSQAGGKVSGYRNLLANRNYSALLIGQFVSFFGDRINYLALVGLVAAETAAFTTADSSLELSKISILMFLPALTLSPMSGVFIDRWNTKKVLVLTDLARALVVALIPLTRAAFQSPVPAYGVILLLYALNAFFLPARSSIMPELVEKKELLPANSLTIFGMILATIFGSFLGGMIVSGWGWKVAFYLDSASYLFSVAALACISYHRPPGYARSRGSAVQRRGGNGSAFLSELREGWKLILSLRDVRSVMILLVAFWIVGASLHVRGIVLVRNVTGNAVRDIGTMISFLATGMLLGSYVSGKLNRKLTPSGIMTSGAVALGVLLMLFGRANSLTQMVLLCFAGGVAAAPVLVTTETVLQSSIPVGKRARIFGSKDFITKSIFMVAALLLGLLGGKPSDRVLFMVLGGAVLLLALAVDLLPGRSRARIGN